MKKKGLQILCHVEIYPVKLNISLQLRFMILEGRWVRNLASISLSYFFICIKRMIILCS